MLSIMGGDTVSYILQATFNVCFFPPDIISTSKCIYKAISL